MKFSQAETETRIEQMYDGTQTMDGINIALKDKVKEHAKCPVMEQLRKLAYSLKPPV